MTLILLHPQLRIDTSVPLRAPCDVLRDDYLRPRALSVSRLARRSGISGRQLHRILLGSHIYAEEALRLSVALRTSPLYWLLLQARYDLEHTQHEIRPCTEGGSARSLCQRY